MRLTYKKLVQLVNEAFKRVEASDMEAIRAYNPRYRGDQVEAGACLIVIVCRLKGDNSPFNTFPIFSFYWRQDLEREINKGAVIGFNLNERYGVRSWIDAEIKPVYLKKTR